MTIWIIWWDILTNIIRLAVWCRQSKKSGSILQRKFQKPIEAYCCCRSPTWLKVGRHQEVNRRQQGPRKLVISYWKSKYRSARSSTASNQTGFKTKLTPKHRQPMRVPHTDITSWNFSHHLLALQTDLTPGKKFSSWSVSSDLELCFYLPCTQKARKVKTQTEMLLCKWIWDHQPRV